MTSDVQDSTNWRIEDKYCGCPLDSISSIPERIESLLARAKDHVAMRTGYLNLSGAQQIVAGMEYHAQNHSKQMHCSTEELNTRKLRHEAVAYFNRLGQFYYFAESAFVKKFSPSISNYIDNITSLTLFRHKHSAHRSLDKPFSEDTDQLQEDHELSFRSNIWSPKDPRFAGDHSNLSETHWLVYQIHNAKDYIDFCLEREHLAVMLECYKIFEEVVKSQEGPQI